MNGEKACFKVFLAFLNAFFCFCAVTLFVFCLFGLKDLMIFAAQQNKSGEKIVEEAEEKLNKVALAGGFGDGFFNGIILENDAEKSLELFFENKPSNAQNNEMREKIDAKIYEFARDELGSVSLEMQTVLEETTQLCLSEINEVFSPRLLNWFCAFFERFFKVFLFGAILFSALSLSTFFLLLRWDRAALKISLFSGGLCCFTGPAVLLFLVNKNDFGIASLWVKDFIKLYLNFGLILMIFAALIIFTVAFCTKKHPVKRQGV